MAAGNILLQANDSKVANIIFEDGASGNMSVIVPKEGGTLASEEFVGSAISAIPVVGDATETIKGKVELATTAEVQTGTDTTRAVTPAGFKGASLGQGQTWQDVTASRVSGTTYTNSTGKPILVFASIVSTQNQSNYVYIDGVQKGRSYTGVVGSIIFPLVFIVPNSSTYSITVGNAIDSWSELR